MPDFCFVDYYNSHIKSSSSALELEFLPLHIVSVFQLKTKLKDTNVGQLFNYLRIVLDYSPESRLFIFGAIPDFRDMQFAKVSRSNDGDHMKYEVSVKPLDDENEYLLHYLTTFFTTDASKFGFYRL